MFSHARSPWVNEHQLDGTEPARHREYFDHRAPPGSPRNTYVQLLVDNRDRVRAFDTQRGNGAAFNFTVQFDPIPNVVAADLKMLSCPKPPGETYAIIDIPQFGDKLQSTDTASHQKFAAVFFEPAGDVKPMRADMISCRRVELDAPTDLKRLDVRLRTWGGAPLVDRGQTTVTMLLELTCRQPPGPSAV